MAVVTSKSTLLTNRDALPKVLTDAFISGGQTSEAYGFTTAAVGDSIGSAYKLCKLPSNSRISSLRMANAALGASVTLAVGVWYPPVIPAGGGAFLSPALAGTLITATGVNAAQSAAAANAAFVDLITTATLTLAQQEMPIWQMIGMSADPEVDLDIGYVVGGAAVGTVGQVAMKIIYIY